MQLPLLGACILQPGWAKAERRPIDQGSPGSCPASVLHLPEPGAELAAQCAPSKRCQSQPGLAFKLDKGDKAAVSRIDSSIKYLEE